MRMSFTRAGRTYYFNEDYSFDGRTIHTIGMINFGRAPSHLITQRGPFQNGDTIIDYRLDPRIMVLPLVCRCENFIEMMDTRHDLQRIFTIGIDPCVIGIEWDPSGRVSYAIDAVISGGLELDHDAKDFNVYFTIQFHAADPTWRSTTLITQPIGGVVIGTPTAYPKPYPVGYGGASLSRVTSLAYGGTAVSYPVIQATGPITGLTMTDTLGNQITFDDPIPAGSVWTIDLTYGAKTVYSQDGINQFAAANIASDFVTWGIYPAPIAPDGSNTISVSGTGTDADSRVNMYYYVRFQGL